MKVHDYGKLIMQVVFVVALVVLAITNVVDGDFVKVGLGTIMGYVFGNGVNAVRGQDTSPLLKSKDDYVPQHAAKDDA